jgi:hypothetical protein
MGGQSNGSTKNMIRSKAKILSPQRPRERRGSFFPKIGRCRFLKPGLPAAYGEPHVREATGWFFFGVISRQRKTDILGVLCASVVKIIILKNEPITLSIL